MRPRLGLALLALLLLSGCAALTKAGWTLPYVGAEPGWTRLDTGLDAQETFTFTALAWDSQRREAIMTAWTHQPFCLRTLTWAPCMAKGPKNDFHNAGYAYDPIHDRYWVSTPSNTMEFWQRATGVLTVHATGGIGMDPAMVYDPPRKRFVGFGGWSEPVGANRVHVFPLEPIAANWATQEVPNGPYWAYPGDAAKMTFTRAGWDAQRARIWYVHPDGVLWWLDPATLTWTAAPTTGVKPEEYAVFGRHEAADRIVAWVGENYMVPSGFPIVRKTYVLNPGTLTWTEWPTANVPPGIASAQSMMVYDPDNQRLLMNTGWNYSRETWALTLGAAPPTVEFPSPATQVALTMTQEPPTQTYPLTLASAGSGAGTTTGGGDYAAGAAVTLTAQPTAGARFDGWTPAPCAPSFAMPGSALTCTASFTQLPITGACLPTTAKTFSPCPVPADINASPFGAESKDLMWTWDSKRKLLYLGMGDSSNTYANSSGNNVMWAYDASTNTWAVASTFCHAAGTVTPNHPSDYGIMVYDPGRDRVWWLGQGDGFPPGQEGQVCAQGVPGWPTGSIRRNGFMHMTPGTNTWAKVSEQATYTIGGAYFDTAGDRILTVETDNHLHEWPMAAMPSDHRPLVHLGDLVPSPPYSGATGGWLPAEYPYRVKWAWDQATRTAYLPLVFRKLDAPGHVIESGVWMVTVNTVTKAVALKARAPIALTVWLDPYAVMSVWDSVNQKVIYPVMSGACGKIEHMLVYHPTTDTWEPTPVPAGTHGASLGYDPVRNVVLLGGRVFCEGYTPNPPRQYLWRYAP